MLGMPLALAIAENYAHPVHLQKQFLMGPVYRVTCPAVPYQILQPAKFLQ